MIHPAKYGQKEVRSCARSHNTECGCMDGHFKVGSGKDFTCKRCSSCLNKQVRRNCSEEADAECGDCLPSFCSVGKTCTPCPTKTPGVELCGTDCKSAAGSCGCLILLVGALVIYCKRRRSVKVSFAGGAKPCGPSELHAGVSSFGTPVPAPLPEAATLMGTGPPVHCGSLQQGRKLYTVIDAVPVRRWKEFVRGLGLRDGEIELVELEHSQFREQQYEMLKRWSQQQGASVDAIFALLEDMQLGGCAQELREQLQPHTLQRSP